MMDKLALEMETFEEILERFEVDVAQAKECGDYSQMVSWLESVEVRSNWCTEWILLYYVDVEVIVYKLTKMKAACSF